MGRNEIRLRRHMMSAGRIARHRNYGDILQRHERELKLKRIVRLVTYFLLIAFFIIVFIMMNRWQQREDNGKEESRIDQTAIPTSMTESFTNISS